MKQKLLVLLALAVLAIMIAIPSFADNSVSVRSSSNSPVPGETFDIIVAVRNKTLKSMAVSFELTDGLTVLNGEWLRDGVIGSYDAEGKKGAFTFGSAGHVNGDVFKLTVRVNEGTTEDQTVTANVIAKIDTTVVFDETVSTTVKMDDLDEEGYGITLSQAPIFPGDTFEILIRCPEATITSAGVEFIVSDGLAVTAGEWLITGGTIVNVDLAASRAVFAPATAKKIGGDIFKIIVQANANADANQTLSLRYSAKNGNSTVFDKSISFEIPLWHTVKYLSEGGEVLSEGVYKYGEYFGEPDAPEKAADETYTYDFAGWTSETVPGSDVYTASYTAVYIDYSVDFLDHDGSVISHGTYHYGDSIAAPGDPSRDPDNTFTYEFAGWDSEVGTVNGNMIFNAQYEGTYIDYTVTFFGPDGEVIESTLYHYGDTVTEPEPPEKAADLVFTYDFAGWDKEVTPVYGDETYEPTYTATYIDYTVTFVDEDGTVLGEGVYHYGDDVAVPGDPVKDSDGDYDYAFSGWDHDVTEVIGDDTYTATYAGYRFMISKDYFSVGDELRLTISLKDAKATSMAVAFDLSAGLTLSEGEWLDPEGVLTGFNPDLLKGVFAYDSATIATGDVFGLTLVANDASDACETLGATLYVRIGSKTIIDAYVNYSLEHACLVVFFDEDGTVISETVYTYGDPVDIPEDPSKDPDQTYTYEFAGWDKEVEEFALSDAEYTAVYSETYIDYTVTFKDYDGTVISETTYHFGDDVDVPEDPSRDADNTFTYEVAGWDKEVAATVDGEAEYTARYTETYIIYTVKFLDHDGSVISETEYHYGDTVTVPEDPERDADMTYTYAFAGWDVEVSLTVEDSVIYTATYDPTFIDYTVTFKDYDGSVIAENTYHYGDDVDIPADPSRIADMTYTYAFAGWDAEVAPTVQGDATYTAAYTPTYIDYAITFYNYDGSVLSESTYHYNDTVTEPETPFQPYDDIFAYEFIGWVPEVTAVTANVGYSAQFKRIFICDYNEDGSVDDADAIYLLYASIFGDFDYHINQLSDLNGDGVLTDADAIYLLFHTIFGEEDYPIIFRWYMNPNKEED